MPKERADLGFSDALDQFDPTEWKTGGTRDKAQPIDKASTIEAATTAGFSSREPRTEPPQNQEGEKPVQRRRRTGRNAQFNLKAKPETIAIFCAIADRQGWGLGETLEKAVELLQREYG